MKTSSVTWMATLVGTVAGIGGWVFGLGRLIWPAHPQWALFFVTLAATVGTTIFASRAKRAAVE